jgi:hypothetical protein
MITQLYMYADYDLRFDNNDSMINVISKCNKSIYDEFPRESIENAIRAVNSNPFGLFSNITDIVNTFLQESINDYGTRTR